MWLCRLSESLFGQAGFPAISMEAESEVEVRGPLYHHALSRSCGRADISNGQTFGKNWRGFAGGHRGAGVLGFWYRGSANGWERVDVPRGCTGGWLAKQPFRPNGCCRYHWRRWASAAILLFVQALYRSFGLSRFYIALPALTLSFSRCLARPSRSGVLCRGCRRTRKPPVSFPCRPPRWAQKLGHIRVLICFPKASLIDNCIQNS